MRSEKVGSGCFEDENFGVQKCSITQDATLWGGIVMCFRFSRLHECV